MGPSHPARTEYEGATLDQVAAGSDPLGALVSWVAAAEARDDVVEAGAMSLATVDADGRPDVRLVICRGIDQGSASVRFFTNTASAKAGQLAAAPHAACAWWWSALHRQVRVRGPVEQLDADEVAEYFASRPRGSRIGAHASRQSRPVASRAELDEAVAAATARLGADEQDGEIPVPADWGGYRVRVEQLELWQGRRSRLHDRIEFTRVRDEDDAGVGTLVHDPQGRAWRRVRLAP